jgi:hypothetical protein
MWSCCLCLTLGVALASAALGQHREVLVTDGPLRTFLEDWIARSVRAHAVKRR